MTTENDKNQKFVMNKEELIEYHNWLIEHPSVKLLEQATEGQRMLERAAQIRKLLEETEQQPDNKNGVEDERKE